MNTRYHSSQHAVMGSAAGLGCVLTPYPRLAGTPAGHHKSRAGREQQQTEVRAVGVQACFEYVHPTPGKFAG